MPDQSPITRPLLPDRVGRLGELASDIWWVWNPAARSVFRELDYGLWRSSAHNPVRLLRLLPTERLEQASRDPIFLARYDQAIKALDRARSGEASWWAQRNGNAPTRGIVYFSAEFALHQSLSQNQNPSKNLPAVRTTTSTGQSVTVWRRGRS